MDPIGEARARLSLLDQPAGNLDRDLTIGGETIRFQGLSAAFAATLETRWGGFFGPAGSGTPFFVVRTVRGRGSSWLPRWKPGEGYRIEADAASGPPVILSYHFALGLLAARTWRLAVEDQSDEPVGRVFDNAARYLTARLAIERGGLALHGAGLLRDGRAWIFAGASGAGKTTAVRLSAPAEGLGDDFAVVLPGDSGWAAPALPFDNSEVAPASPVRGLVPLARIYRLHQASAHRVERPVGALAHASILACAAFPWALPDLAVLWEEAIGRIVASGLYRHLYFAPDAGFWPLLTGDA